MRKFNEELKLYIVTKQHRFWKKQRRQANIIKQRKKYGIKSEQNIRTIFERKNKRDQLRKIIYHGTYNEPSLSIRFSR